MKTDKLSGCFRSEIEDRKRESSFIVEKVRNMKESGLWGGFGMNQGIIHGQDILRTFLSFLTKSFLEGSKASVMRRRKFRLPSLAQCWRRGL